MDFRFYHLSSNPFISHASAHLFWNAVHQSVWDGLHERIDARQGVIGVLGQAGLGKSTLLRAYRASADPRYVHVIDGLALTASPDDLLTNLADACGLTLSSTDPETQFSALYQHCHAVYAGGRQLVWLIDDAHTLSITALGNVHELFKRLHREDEPLLQIVLCGRPTLQQRCHYPDLYLFEQAMPTALTLSPLAVEDRVAYIQHYLQSASTQTTPIFSKGALKLIVDHTHGIPNIINITCSDVLVAGLLAGEKPISSATVQSVLGDDGMRIPSIGLVSAAGLLLALGLWHMWPPTDQTSLPHATAANSQVPLPEDAPSQAPPRELEIAQIPSQSSVPPLTRADIPTERPPTEIVQTPPSGPKNIPVRTSPSAEVAHKQVSEQVSYQAQFKTLLTQAATTVAQIMTALRPTQVGVPKPDMPSNSPVVAPLEAAPIHRDDTATTPNPEAKIKPSHGPVSIPKSADSTPVASAASPTHPSNRPEDSTRLDNHRPPSDLAVSRQPRLTRTPLIASVNARLLCAMPRTSGQLGSDIVLLGHSRHRVHRLIDDGLRNMSPVLSPDGAHLAYTSYRVGTPNVYLRHLASGQDIQPPVRRWPYRAHGPQMGAIYL